MPPHSNVSHQSDLFTIGTQTQDKSIEMADHISGEESYSYNRHALEYIQHAAVHGLYDIRGLGAKRKLPTFDDLVFLTASASRYPLEGYREKCISKTVLGTRFAKKPIELKTPVTIAGMSFGSLSANTKSSVVVCRVALPPARASNARAPSRFCALAVALSSSESAFHAAAGNAVASG